MTHYLDKSFSDPSLPMNKPSPPRGSETAWLVEWPATQDQPVRWWHPRHGWTIDASRALRFSREQDAQDYLETVGSGGQGMRWAVAIEHMWC